MKKNFRIFSLSIQQEFSHRFNFVIWRLRNVLQIVLVFFLWSSVFSDSEKIMFGYDREKILAYVFGILFLKALVFSARTVDVAGEIATGNISNFLIKPINYFRYWAVRDVASKFLNLSFAFLEIYLLYLFFRPNIFIQTNPFYIFTFLISIFFALIIFFLLLFLVNISAFWMPENGWSMQFLFIGIITEFLSGAVFPLDIFPDIFQKILYLTPFPYLVFFPLNVYLGKFSFAPLFSHLGIGATWIVILFLLFKFFWVKGLKRYSAEGN